MLAWTTPLIHSETVCRFDLAAADSILGFLLKQVKTVIDDPNGKIEEKGTASRGNEPESPAIFEDARPANANTENTEKYKNRAKERLEVFKQWIGQSAWPKIKVVGRSS